MNTVLEIDRLYKSFGSNHVLKDFSMRLGKGENIAVLGKSGSGKSVLIKCIVRLVEPEQGSVRLLNEEVLDLSNEDLDSIRSKIGFLFQSRFEFF